MLKKEDNTGQRMDSFLHTGQPNIFQSLLNPHIREGRRVTCHSTYSVYLGESMNPGLLTVVMGFTIWSTERLTT